MPSPEKLKRILLTPEELKLLTPSRTRTETNGGRGNTICPFYHSSNGALGGVECGGGGGGHKNTRSKSSQGEIRKVRACLEHAQFEFTPMTGFACWLSSAVKDVKILDVRQVFARFA